MGNLVAFIVCMAATVITGVNGHQELAMLTGALAVLNLVLFFGQC